MTTAPPVFLPILFVFVSGPSSSRTESEGGQAGQGLAGAGTGVMLQQEVTSLMSPWPWEYLGPSVRGSVEPIAPVASPAPALSSAPSTCGVAFLDSSFYTNFGPNWGHFW